MIVFWIHRAPKARPNLRIPKGTIMMKAFSTRIDEKGIEELADWGRDIGLTKQDIHAGNSGRLHLDLWGNILIRGIKKLLKETHRGYHMESKSKGS